MEHAGQAVPITTPGLSNAALARVLAPGAAASPTAPTMRAALPTLARRISGDPGNLPATPKSTGTVHAAPALADAANAPAPSTATPQGRCLAQPMLVKPKATKDTPIVGDSVAEEDLFERQEANSSSQAQADSGFHSVDELVGTTAAPVADMEADNSLFIEPGPKADDVQQGGIGDCWDMATFISIVNSDPNKIRSIMEPDGDGGATVTFQRRVQTAPGYLDQLMGNDGVKFEAEQVAVSKDLAFNRSGDSTPGADPLAARTTVDHKPYGHQLHGAKLRAGQKPEQSKWFCVVNGTKLEVHRLDVYQMARWAPLLEKAAARFSEQHGQYGHGGQVANEMEKATPGQGYQNIDGGFPGYTMTMFYGKDAQYGQGTGVSGTTWNPANARSAALLRANQAAFDRLLSAAAQGPNDSDGDGRASIATARGLSVDSYIPRLVAAIPAAQADPDYTANVTQDSRNRVAAVLAAANAYTAATPDPTPAVTPPPAGSKTATRNALIAAVRTAVAPATNATLVDSARSEPIKAMLDQLLIVSNWGTDNGGGTRSIYGSHEYSILGVNIVEEGDTPIQSLPAAMRPMFYDKVDTAASTVRIMNPHHKNVPDATGAQAGNDTGVFEVNLERFFRLYGAVVSADVAATPAPPP